MIKNQILSFVCTFFNILTSKISVMQSKCTPKKKVIPIMSFGRLAPSAYEHSCIRWPQNFQVKVGISCKHKETSVKVGLFIKKTVQ